MSAGLPDRAWMTPLLNRIADVAGERAALILASEKASLRFYVPVAVTADHWLSQLIGLEAAAALASDMGGRTIEIPAAMAGQKRHRATAIAEMIDKGYSTNEIARALGISHNTVMEHRRKRPDNGRQMRLF